MQGFHYFSTIKRVSETSNEMVEGASQILGAHVSNMDLSTVLRGLLRNPP